VKAVKRMNKRFGGSKNVRTRFERLQRGRQRWQCMLTWIRQGGGSLGRARRIRVHTSTEPSIIYGDMNRKP
jgi:hypothetical protein